MVQIIYDLLAKYRKLDKISYFQSDSDYDKFNNDLSSFITEDAFLISYGYAQVVITQNKLYGYGKKYKISKYCPIALNCAPELQRRSPYRRVFNQFLLKCCQAGLIVSHIRIRLITFEL